MSWAVQPRLPGPALALALVAFGDIVSQVETAILGFFQSIWSGIQSFFGTIFGAIANTFATIFNAPANSINASFQSLTSWAANFGPLSPVITILIVSAVILIAVVLLSLVVRIFTSEGEQEVGEVEEGV